MTSRNLYLTILEMARADKEITKLELRFNRRTYYQLEKKLIAITAAIDALEALAKE